jgi:hypothetical protein
VGTGTAVVPLQDDMMTPAAAPRTVLRATSDWHIHARNRHIYGREWDAWHTVEGPFVVERDGLYYCLYSGGAWHSENYGISYGVAEHPLGPFRDEWSSEGPTVLRGIPGQVIGPGHNSVVLRSRRQNTVRGLSRMGRSTNCAPHVHRPSGVDAGWSALPRADDR